MKKFLAGWVLGGLVGAIWGLGVALLVVPPEQARQARAALPEMPKLPGVRLGEHPLEALIPTTAEKVDLNALVALYRENPLAVVERYQGRRLRIAGKVEYFRTKPDGIERLVGGGKPDDPRVYLGRLYLPGAVNWMWCVHGPQAMLAKGRVGQGVELDVVYRDVEYRSGGPRDFDIFVVNCDLAK